MARHPKGVGTNGKKLDVKVLVRLMKYVLARYKFRYIVVFVCIAISAFASVTSSIFMKTLIDGYIEPLLLSDVPDFAPLLQALTFMACIYGVGVISNFVYQKTLIVISQGTLFDLRNDLFSHMETLPIQYFDTHAHGDIMSIYTNDIDTLRQVVSQSIPQFLSSMITIISVFCSMVVLSIPLTLVTLSMVVVMQFALRFIMSRSGKYFAAQQQRLGKENGFIEEMMEGAKVVKVFTREEKTMNEFKVINDDLCDAAYKANKYANIMGPVNGNLGNISYVLCAFIGGLLALNNIGSLTLGTLASFLALNRSFYMPINQISQQLNSVIMAMAGAERVFTVIDAEPEVDNGRVTLVNVKEENGKLVECEEVTNHWAWKHPHDDGSETLVELKGDVRFHQVDFSYVEGKQVLFDIDLYAEPGQKLAFVGATGAGKTTMTNLINRFYDVQDGMITYDGIDVKLIKKDDLRRSLGMVLQDTHLFTGTIEENIKYGKPDATHEEVVAAAKLANAHSFIRHLENGYDTMLTRDGSSLSQGQRQLLSIARAALANPPVLILDEATSSIDSRTEKLVQEGMDKLMHGRTTFVIAHRLSTIKNSNAIMVMDKGRIIERGNHDALIEKKGTYYQLYTGLIENS
ncbi:MAG: ABC transporter ATP-binding protein [Erysipelotrichaceae bacterium]|nr:ABC transporter ATP-binding protein [Erysipelotrichaceae bacterium]